MRFLEWLTLQTEFNIDMSTQFTYKAMDSKGNIIEGSMSATNDTDLENRISRMGLDLISIKTQKEKSRLFSSDRTVISRAELINFTFHLEQLSTAGIPLINAITDLRDSTESPSFKNVLSNIVESIESGVTFSEALINYPGIFDDIYISMVEVAEKTGRLPEVLYDLAEMLKWQDELISKAKRVIIYPAFVFFVVSSVTLFLMWYLVPQLVDFINNTESELPFYTVALIATSAFLSDYWYIVIGLPIFILLVIKTGVNLSPAFRFWYDQKALQFPIFGPISYKIKLARFANYFALMYTSGITVLDSIELSKKIMGNIALEDALSRVHTQISEGESISQSFASVGIFSPLIVRMIGVGENTGDMTKSLKNVSYFYSREVSEGIEKIEPTIQPILTIFLGTMILWIIISVMGPIYDTIITIS